MHQPIDDPERPEIVIEELQSGVVARETENGDAYIVDVEADLVLNLEEVV